MNPFKYIKAAACYNRAENIENEYLQAKKNIPYLKTIFLFQKIVQNNIFVSKKIKLENCYLFVPLLDT